MFQWKKANSILKWQNQLLWLILPFFFLPNAVYSSTKINQASSQKIIKFTLFNYDNLIADHYEDENRYIKQLAYLLEEGTGCSKEKIALALKDDALASEADPVKYMIMINKKIKFSCGYYFIDD